MSLTFKVVASEQVPKDEIWFVSPAEAEYQQAYKTIFGIELPLVPLVRLVNIWPPE